MSKQGQRTGYKRGFVPAKPIVALIDEYLEENADVDRGPMRRLIFEIFGADQNEVDVRNEERSIRRLRDQRWMGFDRADLFVTRLGGWMQNAKLQEAYRKVNLLPIDLRHPTCRQVHRENKKWISQRLKELGSLQALTTELGMDLVTKGRLRHLLASKP